MNTDQATRLPLNTLHESLGARMVTFAGFRMPVQYAGLKAEHLHTRTRAGLFDVSHMGQLRVSARDGLPETLHRSIESALPLDFDAWPDDTQRYSLLLNEQGGIEDDLMVINRLQAEGELRIVVNAGNRDADLARFTELCPDLRFDWVDNALIALQGPRSEQVLSRFDPAAGALRFMQAASLVLDGSHCLATRSGYTGEDGYEISVPAADAPRIVDRLLADADVMPIGLGARDSLRLEAGLPLHGNDITPQTTPCQAGLSFAVARNRRTGAEKAGGFPGAGPVLDEFAHPPKRRLIGLTSFESIPIRAGASIRDQNDSEVGEVTSGTVSPTLNRPIMLAYVDRDVAGQTENDQLHAVVRNKRPVVVPTALPFVAKRYQR